MTIDAILALYEEALASKLDYPVEGVELWFLKQDNGEGERVITITTFKKKSAIKRLYTLKTSDGWTVYWYNYTKSKVGEFFPHDWAELPWRKV